MASSSPSPEGNSESPATDSSWTPLNPESLVAAPCLIEQTLCQPSDKQPQLAKDYDYALAVLDAWKAEEADAPTPWTAETRPVQYSDSAGQTLYGHLVRRPTSSSSSDDNNNANDSTKTAGIILFPTAAGPHDVFMLWKAVALVNSKSECQVLIADTLGDDTGWSWDADRTRYAAARDHVLSTTNTDNNNNNPHVRSVLQDRLRAAVETIKAEPAVDASRLAAAGWCFGGHAVLELGRMHVPGMRAMATFHGVFDGLPAVPTEPTTVDPTTASEMLLCHGTQDPFCSEQAMERALETLQYNRHTVSLLQLKAKHGFTNPAQDFNANPAFGYDAPSADKAWRQTLALFHRTVGGGDKE